MATSPLEGVKFRLVDSIDDLWAMKAWAGERRDTPLMFDTETTGLNPERDRIRLIQLGDKQRGWAVPWDLWGGGALEILKKYEGRLGAHNRSFDLRFLITHSDWDPPWERIDDTLTMAHLINPQRPRGLKPLADRLVDPRASAGETVLHDGMKKQGWTWATVPLAYAPYWLYAAADPVLTAFIWEKLEPDVHARYAKVYDLEQAVNRVCAQMMLRGMKVDVPYIHQRLGEIKTFSQETRAWLSGAHGVSSPMSAQQIAKAFEAWGQEIEWWTDNNAPQMDKESLGWYQQNAVAPEISQLCQYILKIRHAEKMAGTYLENLLKMRDTQDRVHASIWPLGARTGRMSITDPALQTLPRDDLIVRGAFIPREGCVLISCDYSQIEARLAAHFAQDQGLVTAFKIADEDSTDFFAEIATDLWNVPVSKADRRRQMVKNMVYARIYGAGLAKMALTAGVPVPEMRRVKEKFDYRYPGLDSMTRKIMEDARAIQAEMKKPGVYTPLGRFLPGEAGREYALVNYLIQSHASEVLKQAMLDLDAAGLGDAMLVPVHDEIVFEVPAAEADEAMQTIQWTMENRRDYAVPITCEPKLMTERWFK